MREATQVTRPVQDSFICGRRQWAIGSKGYIRIGATAGFSVVALVGVVAALRSPQKLVGGVLALGSANQPLLLLSALMFLLGALATARAWRAGMEGCGADASASAVTSRYAVGSLANSFSPAPAGELVRIALLSQLIRAQGARYTVAGICTTVAVIRIFVTGIVFGAVAWTTPATTTLAEAALAITTLVALSSVMLRLPLRGRLAHLGDAARGLRRSPRLALSMFAWIATTTFVRIVAVSCAVGAFGVPRPWLAALLIVPAVELASLVPFVPGNLGVTSALITLALRDRHVALLHAISVGLALHAIELAVGICFGLGGVLVLGHPRVVRRMAPVFAAIVPAGLLGLWATGLT
jgi:hypothetical protein